MIGIGTRWSRLHDGVEDRVPRSATCASSTSTSPSSTPRKHAGIALLGDARATLERLARRCSRARGRAPSTARAAASCSRDWDEEVDAALLARPRAAAGAERGDRRRQRRVRRRSDVVVCAAGSMPGDLHKLWRTRDPKGYHVEYGYSCMGYEIAGGLGVKLAAPEREVYVLVGDGSYLMMPSEIVTAVQEGAKLTIVLVDNRGFASIGALSRSLGHRRLRHAVPLPPRRLARHRLRRRLRGVLPVDLAANAESLGARVDPRRDDRRAARRARTRAKAETRTTVIAVATDRYEGVPGYESWWDVPVAEVVESAGGARRRADYDDARVQPRGAPVGCPRGTFHRLASAPVTWGVWERTTDRDDLIPADRLLGAVPASASRGSSSGRPATSTPEQLQASRARARRRLRAAASRRRGGVPAGPRRLGRPDRGSARGDRCARPGRARRRRDARSHRRAGRPRSSANRARAATL